MGALTRLVGYPGQLLARVWRTLTRKHTDNLTGYCSRWGCLLPVNETSPYGMGPCCMVCRYGLRAVALEADDGQARRRYSE